MLHEEACVASQTQFLLLCSENIVEPFRFHYCKYMYTQQDSRFCSLSVQRMTIPSTKTENSSANDDENARHHAGDHHLGLDYLHIFLTYGQ